MGHDEATVVKSVRPLGVKNANIFDKLVNKKSDVHGYSSITGYQVDIFEENECVGSFYQ